ncbi:hypothetical protein FK85_13905 [Halorubrum saccharovorum]|uniref:Uncharacterized protein n=1 Tax=Halorubrum saccharovorum TaxID=2248 RepID=A0A081EX06_9EURY|nr:MULTISPECIES: hypothetical protein [Halorubrum]KDS91944.1 hypothetical protein FK85_13905 [Halorubrum saccharovorum]
MTEHVDVQATDDEGDGIEVDRRGDDADAEGEADTESDDGTGHLDDIEDGAGCTEIWERLSERRDG